LTTTTNTTTVHINDYHLDQATIEIKGVDGYWPIVFNVVIPQDQNIAVSGVTNGDYEADTKTFTAAYGSSTYKDHELSFALNRVVLSADNIVVKTRGGTTTTNG